MKNFKIMLSIFRDDLPALRKALDITSPFIKSVLVDEVSKSPGNLGVIIEIDFEEHATIEDVFFVGVKFGEYKKN